MRRGGAAPAPWCPSKLCRTWSAGMPTMMSKLSASCAIRQQLQKKAHNQPGQKLIGSPPRRVFRSVNLFNVNSVQHGKQLMQQRPNQ
mmetsp:Transcript_28414/g.49615  ORF Transcript_28414/g.49615 Transcript_28414/m.49615 type:complete len:87 (+) Transcript_28414:53-313(+)